MILKLQRAHRVRDLLDRIRLPMGVVVHRINAPLVAGAVMRSVQDAVHHRVAHVQVGRSHVDLGAQNTRAVGKFARLHALEQVQILFDRTIAIRAVFARLGQRAAVFADLVRGEIVDVGLAVLDQLDRPLVELIEVVGGVVEAIPVKAQPLHVLHDGVDVLGLLLRRIGVVEAQVGMAVEFVGEAEVQTDRLRVADVQVAVGLGRKAGLHAALRTCWS